MVPGGRREGVQYFGFDTTGSAPSETPAGAGTVVLDEEDGVQYTYCQGGQLAGRAIGLGSPSERKSWRGRGDADPGVTALDFRVACPVGTPRAREGRRWRRPPPPPPARR